MWLVKRGAVSQSRPLFIQDSSKTTGEGLAGLLYNSSNLIGYYRRQGQATWTQITLADMTVGTWASGGFKETDATHAAGDYEFGIPNAAIASAAGVDFVEFRFQGATNMCQTPVMCVLTAYDPYEQSLGLGNVVNTGAVYNVNNSIGKQIRIAAGNVPITLLTGTASAGSANTITLTGGSSVNGIYVGQLVEITSGTGAGQSRTIVAYNGTTKVATVSSNWLTNPDATSVFSVIGSSASNFLVEGNAQAGGASTVTLPSSASTTDNIYDSNFVSILSGTGNGQTRVITAYNGTTKVATTDSAWGTQPDSTSVIAVFPNAQQAADSIQVPTPAQIAAGILSTSVSTAPTTGTVEEALLAARAQAFGKWVLTGTSLVLYAPDGVTAIKTFTLNDANNPTSRT